MRTSEKLVTGKTYSRAELSDVFAIKDATIRNGIFRPKGHESIWLFITEEKTPTVHSMLTVCKVTICFLTVRMLEEQTH